MLSLMIPQMDQIIPINGMLKNNTVPLDDMILDQIIPINGMLKNPIFALGLEILDQIIPINGMLKNLAQGPCISQAIK